jgi:protein KRI1
LCVGAAQVLGRLQAIQEVSGSAVPFSEVDLSGDFDPEAFDKRMAEVFNEGFYEQDDAGFEDPEGEWGSGDAPAAGGGGKQSVEALAAHLKKQGSEGVRTTAQQYMDEYYAVDYEVRRGRCAARLRRSLWMW